MTTTGSRSVLIFGGAGFIGSNWASTLLKHADAKVHIFDNLSRQGALQNLRWLRSLAGDSGRLKITLGDVRDPKMVELAVRDATEIYNFAAQVAVTTSIEDPRQDFETNVAGTLNILEAARRSDKDPFLLYTSTNKVYGTLRPSTPAPQIQREASRYTTPEPFAISEEQPLDFHSPYGCSKGAADQYVHDYSRIYGLRTVVFRMSCIAGPRQFGTEDQGWVAHFLYSALRRTPIVVYGNGLQVRDVLCIDDLLLAFDMVRTSKQAEGQVFNVGGGSANTVSLLELITSIEQVTGRGSEVVWDEMRPGDQLIYITDHSKLSRITGWAPTVSVPETLERIYAWWKSDLATRPASEDADSVAAPLAGSAR